MISVPLRACSPWASMAQRRASTYLGLSWRVTDAGYGVDQPASSVSSMVSSRPAVTRSTTWATATSRSARCRSTGPTRREVQERHPLDRPCGGGGDRRALAGALQAVPVRAPVEFGGIVGRRRLVVDDDEAVVGRIEKVDVALEQPSVDRRARTPRQCRPPAAARTDGAEEGVHDELTDLIGSARDRLRLALRGDGGIEAVAVARSIVCSVPCTARPTAVP